MEVTPDSEWQKLNKIMHVWCPTQCLPHDELSVPSNSFSSVKYHDLSLADFYSKHWGRGNKGQISTGCTLRLSGTLFPSYLPCALVSSTYLWLFHGHFQKACTLAQTHSDHPDLVWSHSLVMTWSPFTGPETSKARTYAFWDICLLSA